MSSEDKPRLSLKLAKIETVCRFLLQHPHAKDFEVMDELKCARRTVSYARAKLVEQGLLPEPRKKTGGRKKREPSPVPRPSPSAVTSAPEAQPDESYADQLVTPSTVAMLAAGPDLDEDIETDVETQRRMTREAKKMAFDLKLHPQIRMDAMTLWVKLKDAAKARDLGPGKPMTRAAALTRLKDMHTAVGIDLVLLAVCELWGMDAIKKIIDYFGHKGTPDASANDEAAAAGGSSPDAVETRHDDSEAQAEDLRSEHVALGENAGGQEESLEHPDPSGPEA